MLSHFWTHASKLESIAGEKGRGQILFILKLRVMLTLLFILCGHNEYIVTLALMVASSICFVAECYTAIPPEAKAKNQISFRQ